MYGVVLWSDARDRRAVIWCEDHGDLAFYNGLDEADCPSPDTGLDPGDLVQFEIRNEQDLRRACQPRLIAEAEFPSLANDLARFPSSRPRGESSNVVSLFPAGGSRCAQAS